MYLMTPRTIRNIKTGICINRRRAHLCKLLWLKTYNAITAIFTTFSTIFVHLKKKHSVKTKTFSYRTSGCASNIARISVVPDRGTPPININGIFLWYGYTFWSLPTTNFCKQKKKKFVGWTEWFIKKKISPHLSA